MSQHDMSIVNQGFPAFRADLNDALPALASNNSGATEPSTMFAHQWWVDTSATPNLLKQRNADNDAWITVGSLDQSADTFTLAAGSAGAFSTLSASGTSTLAAVNSGALAVTGALSATSTLSLGGVTALIRRNTVSGSAGVVIQGNTSDTLNDTNPGASISVGGGAFSDTYEGRIEYRAYGTAGVDYNRNSHNFYTRTGVNTSTLVAQINSTGLAVTGAISATELISANKGITFPATQVASADANTLDDYEEGTWTPTGNGVTLTINTTCNYVKVGKQITLTYDVTWPSTASALTADIFGAPFAVTYPGGTLVPGYTTGTVNTWWASGTEFASRTVTNANMSTGRIIGSAVYFV